MFPNTHQNKPKITNRGFSMGATRDSDDEIFFPTTEDNEWEPEKLPTQDQESKITTSNDQEQSTNNLQTETLIQRFGIFERQEHHQNKLENWSLTPKKPIILLGDSNFTHLPQIKNEKIQVVSYPGAKLEHIFHILKNKTNMAPDVHVLVLFFGTNNREEGNTTKLKKIVERVKGVARTKFPTAAIYFPLINYNHTLPAHIKENLDILNQIIQEKTHYIPLLPNKSFRTTQDKIHWTKQTGEAMAEHWLKYLGIQGKTKITSPIRTKKNHGRTKNRRNCS